MVQAFSLLGALAILTAYTASQLRRMNPNGLIYLLLNTVGAGVLSVIAWLEQQWGFLLLEGVWTLVSLYALTQQLRSGSSPNRR